MNDVLLSVGLLILQAWALAGIAIVLHGLSARFGISLLLMYTAAVVGILTYADPVTLFIEPIDGLIFTLPSDILITLVLLVILILYVVDGTEIARIIIFGIALIQILVAVIFLVINAGLYLPLSTEVGNREVFAGILQVNLQLMLGGVVAFFIDMFVVAVVYQGIYNRLPRYRQSIAIGVALLAAVWCDALVFNTIAAINRGGFLEFLPGT